MQRYHDYYVNRTRGERRKAEAAIAEPSVAAGLPSTDPELPEGGVTVIETEGVSRGEAKRRWAELHPASYCGWSTRWTHCTARSVAARCG